VSAVVPAAAAETATAERAKFWPDEEEYIARIIGGRVPRQPIPC
jgi:hypothetical protein